MKICARCEQEKPRKAFTRQTRQPDGLDRWCRACKAEVNATYVGRLSEEKRAEWLDRRRTRRPTDPESARKRRNQFLLGKFGITLDDYERMLVAQSGCCKICGTSDSGLQNGVFAVDHDHATGLVRGLLCRVCNIHVGYVERAGLELVLAYLEQSRERVLVA